MLLLIFELLVLIKSYKNVQLQKFYQYNCSTFENIHFNPLEKYLSKYSKLITRSQGERSDTGGG